MHAGGSAPTTGICPGRATLSLVLDLGCGPGARPSCWRNTLKTRVIAVDIHQPYLDRLNQNATAEGLSELIETHCGDFGALDIPRLSPST